MQFMVLMIPALYQPKAGKKADAHFKPDPRKMEPMGRFNEAMQKEMKILALAGLKPPSVGARVAFSKGQATVTDGPAVHAPEVLGGYWLIEAQSKEQVVEWMKKCPAEDGDVVEIRPVFELSDFTHMSD